MKHYPFDSISSPDLVSVADERAYQGLTIAAMILLLATLWAF